jgi:ketosteroid isomerase-like protein
VDQSLAQQIEAREAEWTTAYNANDAERLSAIYEDDAVFIAPGMPPLRGDHAVVVGHSTQQELQEDGSWKDSVNNYQVLYHRGSDGEWYYATDMFNHR